MLVVEASVVMTTWYQRPLFRVLFAVDALLPFPLCQRLTLNMLAKPLIPGYPPAGLSSRSQPSMTEPVQVSLETMRWKFPSSAGDTTLIHASTEKGVMP